MTEIYCFHLYMKIEAVFINWSFEMQPITKFMFYRNVDKEEEVLLPNGIRYVYFIIIAHNLTFEVLSSFFLQHAQILDQVL